MTANALTDFLKYANTTKVRAHTRAVGGHLVQVEAHDRETEDHEAEEAEKLRVRAVDLAARKKREIALWQAWKDSGKSPNALRPLLQSFMPLIRSKASVHMGRVRMIPDAAIMAEYQIQFVNALQNYDPEKGSLGTYVYRYLDKAKRFIAENQNIGRIPENRIYRIREFQTAQELLSEKTGKIPSEEALAEELGWSLPDVKRMTAELRNDLVTQGFEEDPFSLIPSKSEEVLRLFRYELTGLERDVYEYLTGYGKPRVTSTGEIAKLVGVPDYQVSRIKNSIQRQISVYLKN